MEQKQNKKLLSDIQSDLAELIEMNTRVCGLKDALRAATEEFMRKKSTFLGDIAVIVNAKEKEASK